MQKETHVHMCESESSDPALPLTRPATLSKSFHFSELQFFVNSVFCKIRVAVNDIHIFFHFKRNGCCPLREDILKNHVTLNKIYSQV